MTQRMRLYPAVLERVNNPQDALFFIPNPHCHVRAGYVEGWAVEDGRNPTSVAGRYFKLRGGDIDPDKLPVPIEASPRGLWD